MRVLFILALSFLFVTTIAAQNKSVEGVLKEEAVEYRQQGYRFQRSGNLREALKYYEKAVELDPQYTEAYNDIGVLYESKGQQNAALRMYKRAIELDPDYLPTYTNIAMLYEKRGDMKSAVHYWKERYRKGKRGEFWREKAREKLYQLGDYPEIKRELLEEDAASLSKEMVYQFEQERLKNTEEARLHFEVSVGLFHQGDFSEALKELETALALDPDDEELKLQITDFYVQAKRAHVKQQMRHHVEKAMMEVDENDYVAASREIEKALAVVNDYAK